MTEYEAVLARLAEGEMNTPDAIPIRTWRYPDHLSRNRAVRSWLV
jgi:hypothetical protein